MRPLTLPSDAEKPKESIKAAVVNQNANKRFATESVENISGNKPMRLRNDVDHSHRLSVKLDDGKGPSCGSSRLNDGFPKNKILFRYL